MLSFVPESPAQRAARIAAHPPPPPVPSPTQYPPPPHPPADADMSSGPGSHFHSSTNGHTPGKLESSIHEHASHHSRGSNAGAELSEQLKGAWHGIHGAGDSIRGNSLGFVDSLFHSEKGMTRDDEIAARGKRDVQEERERLEGEGKRRGWHDKE